jgi:hypothetical protein
MDVCKTRPSFYTPYLTSDSLVIFHIFAKHMLIGLFGVCHSWTIWPAHFWCCHNSVTFTWNPQCELTNIIHIVTDRGSGVTIYMLVIESTLYSCAPPPTHPIQRQFRSRCVLELIKGNTFQDGRRSRHLGLRKPTTAISWSSAKSLRSYVRTRGNTPPPKSELQYAPQTPFIGRGT